MHDVERVLSSPDKACVLSKSGRRTLKRSKLLCLLKFTLWQELFPINLSSVLAYLKDVVRELHSIGLQLHVPQSILDTLEADLLTDPDRARRKLVKGWMSSSPDPPCWWHLVQALHAAERGTLAVKITKEFGSPIDVQKKLLNQHNHSLRPDAEFLQSLADVVGSKWSSLAASLSLSGDEIEEVKGEGHTQQEMLRKWATKEGATYGQLYQTLKTIPLFQHCK